MAFVSFLCAGKLVTRAVSQLQVIIAFCSWCSGDARCCTLLDHLVCGLVRVMNWVSWLLSSWRLLMVTTQGATL
jgi:hypothetical protein